jgi:pimeloyl-ACP methyl ester carboxylesterase
MELTVEGAPAYCYTSGKNFDAALPCAVFLHGAQNDHSVWALQSRYFAHHGFNVLALDLPGHGRSKGKARTSIEAMSHWMLALLDAAGVRQAALIGHSMGSLIALHTAHIAPQRVNHLALLGATYPMKVSDALLQAALTDEASAFDMVNTWSHLPFSQQASHKAVKQQDFPGPGFYKIGAALRLKQRIAQINPQQVLYHDFFACNAYQGGAAAAATVACPTLFICGARDMMTPARSAKGLIAAIAHASVVQVESGHEMMAEQPDAVLDALFDFCRSGASR